MKRILTSVAIAAVTVVATFALAGDDQYLASEAAAPLVEGYVSETDRFADGTPWLYVKVRHPRTGALFGVRVVLKKKDGKTFPESRLLEGPK